VRYLVAALLSISSLRLGTLVLIPSDENNRPDSAGRIDDSQLAVELQSATVGRRFSELLSAGSAIGVLTSDGLTTVSRAGVVIGSGEIIGIRADELSGIGGGRTQAAKAASQFGLVIKVSEDGPAGALRLGHTTRLPRFQQPLHFAPDRPQIPGKGGMGQRPVADPMPPVEHLRGLRSQGLADLLKGIAPNLT
jgi:hypothetical protein